MIVFVKTISAFARTTARLIGVSLLLCAVCQSIIAPKSFAETLPSYQRTSTFDTSPGGSVHPSSVTNDSLHNVYITGNFTGSIDFDGGSDTDVKTAPNSSTGTFITKLAPDGSYLWTNIFDTSSGEAVINGIKTDSEGNTYTAGYFSGTVTFDGVGGVHSQLATSTSPFLLKLNASGNYVFTKFILSTGSDQRYAHTEDLALDNVGNIYVAGQFNNTQNFAGNDGTDIINDPNINSDSFITKYNNLGVYQWTKIADNSQASNSNISNRSISIDTNQNIIVAGFYYDTITFDGPGGSDTRGSNPIYGSNSFITKLHADGSYAFTRTLGNSTPYSGNNSIMSATTDSDGNIYATGYYEGTINFAGALGVDARTSLGTVTFLIKFDASGNYLYTKEFANTNNNAYNYSSKVAVDDQDGVYVAGTFYDQVDFSSNGSDVLGIADTYGVSLAKFNKNGTYLWTKVPYTTTGSAGSYEFAAMTLDSDGRIYISSDFQGTVTFDGPGGSDTRTNLGNSYNFYVTSYRVLGASTAVAIPVVKAENVSKTIGVPNTGFNTETHQSHWVTINIVGLMASAFLGIILFRHRIRKTIHENFA